MKALSILLCLINLLICWTALCAGQLTSEVRRFKGMPSLFVNGKLTSSLTAFTSDIRDLPDFLKAGFRIVDMNVPYDWVGPEKYDFRKTDEEVDRYLRQDPAILLLPRINAIPGNWWCDKFPQDITLKSDGSRAGTPATANNDGRRREGLSRAAFSIATLRAAAPEPRRMHGLPSLAHNQGNEGLGSDRVGPRLAPNCVHGQAREGNPCHVAAEGRLRGIGPQAGARCGGRQAVFPAAEPGHHHRRGQQDYHPRQARLRLGVSGEAQCGGQHHEDCEHEQQRPSNPGGR